MKKESITAIVFGITLGVILAIVFIFQSKENQLSRAKPINNQNKTITPKIKMASTTILEVAEPSDNLIVDAKSITIKGKTNKNALVIINSPIKETVFKNTKEEFSMEFPLALGENVIQITAYPDDKTGQSISKTLKIYYLTANN